jgi:lipopolysaccharide export system protein LptC
VYLPETRTLIALALLTAGAIGSSLLLLNNKSDKKSLEPPELSLAFYLNKAELTGTGPKGEIVYRVWTENAVQSASDETITMDGVRMEYDPMNGMPWKLRANTGTIEDKLRTIQLSGDVVATGVEDEQSVVIIRTQVLDMDPETQEASTDGEVTIDYNGRILKALGMRANLKSNQVKLLADVNGKFIP